MMHVIGVTGGVGSGKSAVLDFLEEAFDAVILKTDDVAKELMLPGTDCFSEIIAAFGEEIRTSSGELDRVQLAELIFHDRQKLQQMNQIVHPAVKRAVRERIKIEETNGRQFFFLESALLIEEKYDEICEELWYVYAGIRIRRERLGRSRGYSEEKTDSILKNQLSEESFRAYCSFVIDNSGTFAETEQQIWEYMKKYGIEGCRERTEQQL